MAQKFAPDSQFNVFGDCLKIIQTKLYLRKKERGSYLFLASQPGHNPKKMDGNNMWAQLTDC